MIFLENIARLISPSLGRQADRFHYLWHQVDDCHRWLSEFSDVAVAMKWLKEKDRDYWRQLEEPAIGELPSNIVDFREFLRSRSNPTNKPPERCQDCDGYNCNDGCAYPDASNPNGGDHGQ